MKYLRKSILGLILLGAGLGDGNAQPSKSAPGLDARQLGLVKISALTATGDLSNLERALEEGLGAGLSVNEIKEVLVHLYAYCGFPRSIRGLQTFMGVLEKRQAKGISDRIGNESSRVTREGSKYERGRSVLGELTGVKQDGSLTGYSAFAPVIDTFLKEHLFADIFERDVLTYAQRELVTISVLSSIGGVEPMLRGHLSISLNVGLTPEQLTHFIAVIESVIGNEKGAAARTVLTEVLKSR